MYFQAFNTFSKHFGSISWSCPSINGKIVGSSAQGIPWDAIVDLLPNRDPMTCSDYTVQSLSPSCPIVTCDPTGCLHVPWWTYCPTRCTMDPTGCLHVQTMPCSPSVYPVPQSHGTHGIPWDVYMSHSGFSHLTGTLGSYGHVCMSRLCCAVPLSIPSHSPMVHIGCLHPWWT